MVQGPRGGSRSSLTITCSNPRGGPHSSVGLEVPKMAAFLTGESKDPLNYKLQLPLGHFGLCVARNQQARVTLLSGAIHPRSAGGGRAAVS